MRYLLVQSLARTGKRIYIDIPEIDSEEYSTPLTEKALESVIHHPVWIDDMIDHHDNQGILIEGLHTARLMVDVPGYGGSIRLLSAERVYT